MLTYLLSVLYSSALTFFTKKTVKKFPPQSLSAMDQTGQNLGKI